MIRRLTDMDADELELVGSSEEPTVIFDPAKLTAQLSELLELYLARAKEALQEEQMSSKEAVACAKQVSGMLEDTQSGKLAKVDTTTHWPKLEFVAVAQPQMRVGRAHQPGSYSVQQPTTGNQQPLRSLEDAVRFVCQYDEETAILEPWERVLIRLNQLTQRLSADIEAWKSSCEDCRAGTCAPPSDIPVDSTSGGPRVAALQQTSSSVQQPTTKNQQPASGHT